MPECLTIEVCCGKCRRSFRQTVGLLCGLCRDRVLHENDGCPICYDDLHPATDTVISHPDRSVPQHGIRICGECAKVIRQQLPSDGRAPTPPGWAWEKAVAEYEGNDRCSTIRARAAEIAREEDTKCNE